MNTQTPLRILCVEDDVFIRSNAVEALKDAGFEVLEAQNSDEALELMGHPDSVDVLFTDVRMPGKWDGVDLVEQIRANHPNMPAVITSGYALHLSRRLNKLSPPAIFIGKPYSLSEVVNTLKELAIRQH
jgi:CheY-like chemotaxis protein